MLYTFHFYFYLLCNKCNTRFLQVMSPTERVGGPAQGGNPLWWSTVRERPDITNWKKSRQCPRPRHWTRCSPYLVTCRSGCARWNLRSPDMSIGSKRSLRKAGHLRFAFGRKSGYESPFFGAYPTTQEITECLAGHLIWYRTTNFCWNIIEHRLRAVVYQDGP